MPLDRDDQPFRHYTFKHRVISWISQTFFDRFTYTVRRGLLKGMKRQGGLAWIPDFGSDAGQTPENRFFAALDVSGKVVFDVGAFEGLVTLFFAPRARQVVCYEPNSRNYGKLLRNLELNRIGNVTVRKLAVGAEPGASRMAWDASMAGGATLTRTGISRVMESRKVEAQYESIQVTTLDQDLAEAQLPEPDLIKVDVEGYELPVLQGARHLLERKHPALYLEMHGETMNEKRVNARAVVEFLNTLGYSSILHVESGENITVGNSERAAQGHLFAAGQQ